MKDSEREFCEETILSLDTATHTGYAVYKDGKIIESGVWNLGRTKEMHDPRHCNLLNHIDDIVDKYNVTILVAEEIYKDPARHSAFMVLAELRGVVKLAAYDNYLSLRFIDYRRVQDHILPYNLYRRTLTDAQKSEQRELNKMKMVNGVKARKYEIHTTDPKYINDEADAIAQLLYFMHSQGYIAPTPSIN